MPRNAELIAAIDEGDHLVEPDLAVCAMRQRLRSCSGNQLESHVAGRLSYERWIVDEQDLYLLGTY